MPTASILPDGCGSTGRGAGVDVGVRTHAGQVRSVNEDSYVVAPDLGIFAVADGMGGHDGGVVASRTVVESLASLGCAVSASDLLARVEDRVMRANAILQKMVAEKGSVIGSTVAILLIFDDHFACLWSGDSRIYRIRANAIRQLSRDHTEIRDLVERGILAPEEAKTWPRRHVITRAIGVRPEPELELEHGQLEAGDVFVICSDGLTGHVEDHEVLAHAGPHAGRGSSQAACDALLALTLERGATDNVTLIVVRPEGGRVLAPAGRPASVASQTVVVGAGLDRGSAKDARS